jgi:hypothetical protein
MQPHEDSPLQQRQSPEWLARALSNAYARGALRGAAGPQKGRSPPEQDRQGRMNPPFRPDHADAGPQRRRPSCRPVRCPMNPAWNI